MKISENRVPRGVSPPATQEQGACNASAAGGITGMDTVFELFDGRLRSLFCFSRCVNSQVHLLYSCRDDGMGHHFAPEGIGDGVFPCSTPQMWYGVKSGGNVQYRPCGVPASLVSVGSRSQEGDRGSHVWFFALISLHTHLITSPPSAGPWQRPHTGPAQPWQPGCGG